MKSKSFCMSRRLGDADFSGRPGRPRLLCMALAALMIFGNGATALAEEYEGGDWNVEFTGEGMVSNFSSADISDAVYSLQPGDSVTISLDLENKSGRATEWYMTNRVLSSLEDHSDQARGGAYAYRLAYTGQDGEETVFFDSSTIGGEKSAAAGVGLHEAVEDMDEYFRLDTLTPGERGTVTLSVALDGETQGNDYQNTLADLSMSFAVDTLVPTADDDPGKDRNPGGPGQDGGQPGQPGGQAQPGSGAYSYSTGGVKTGDSSNLALWSCVAFGSGALLLVMALLGLRRSRKEEAA